MSDITIPQTPLDPINKNLNIIEDGRQKALTSSTATVNFDILKVTQATPVYEDDVVNFGNMNTKLKELGSRIIPSSATTNEFVHEDGTKVLAANIAGSWSTQTNAVGTDLFSTCFADSLNGWACGADGVITHTTDGGANWASQSSGVSVNLWSITCIDKDHAWVCGNGGTILATANGGASWSPKTSGTAINLRSIVFADALNGWVCGGAQILGTTDGGASWSQVAHNKATDLRCISFNSGSGYDNMVVASDYNGKIHISQDVGVSWSSSITGYNAVLAVCAKINTIWAVNVNGGILRSDDNGASWTPQTSGLSSSLWSINFVDQDNGWICGESGKILKTTDGGNSWSITTNGSYYLLSVSFTDKQHGWVVGYNAATYNYLAYDPLSAVGITIPNDTIKFSRGGKLISGFTGLTAGLPLYASPTVAGSYVQNISTLSVGQYIIQLGSAVSATEIEFDPKPAVELI